MDIITNSDSKKLNRAARPANGGALNRGFDAAIDFIDERFEDIARLIAACRHAAAWLWGSKLYFPLCFLVQAGFMAAGHPIVGGILTMSLLIFMLLIPAYRRSVQLTGCSAVTGRRGQNRILLACVTIGSLLMMIGALC